MPDLMLFPQAWYGEHPDYYRDTSQEEAEAEEFEFAFPDGQCKHHEGPDCTVCEARPW